MLATAAADEVLRYLYVASLRPLTTLAAFAALIALTLALAGVAWHEHRASVASRDPKRPRPDGLRGALSR